MLYSGRVILIAPIDWGLGHSTRCIPLIQKLSHHNTVLIGVTDVNKTLFERYFPGHELLSMPSYNIRYSARLPVWLKILLQTPRIMQAILREHRALKKILAAKKIDLIISDNRPGFYSKEIGSIYITHQLNIKSPLFPGLASGLHRKAMSRFSEIWVPDFADAGESLAGELSHAASLNLPLKYIEPLSALKPPEVEPALKYDLLVLLSGAEPQRSILEKLLITVLRQSPYRILIVRGTHIIPEAEQNKNIHVVNFCTGSDLAEKILQSGTVVCRSGYSTLMDMHVLGKKELILIPTPGQSEQEYLAELWHLKFGAEILLQKDISRKGVKIHSHPAQSCTSSCI